jgi:hypothetical protein
MACVVAGRITVPNTRLRGRVLRSSIDVGERSILRSAAEAGGEWVWVQLAFGDTCDDGPLTRCGVRVEVLADEVFLSQAV